MLMPGALPATMPSAASMHQALESQKDTTLTKIFVGGLPYHTTDKSLREHFEVYGDIEEAVVITDRQTGKSRGYGFVTMADKGGAERAIKEPNPVIDGRKANVNLAYLGAKPRGPAAGEDQIYGIPLTSMRYPAMIPGQYSWAFPNNLRTSYYSRAALCGQTTEGAENMHPNYQIYQQQYLPTAAGLMPMSHSHLNPAAAALSAAASQQYFDYTSAATAAAAASYPQAAAYQNAAAAASALEPYSAISAASMMSQQYAMPAYTWTMPQGAAAAASAAASAAATAGTMPLNPYQTAQSQLQEARIQ